MSEPKSQDKPFDIAKWVVWEAYQRVKANKGAAGVDDESIAEFEQDRDKNLYRIWNRMSSGCYFPPPVKGKQSGGCPLWIMLFGVASRGWRTGRRGWRRWVGVRGCGR